MSPETCKAKHSKLALWIIGICLALPSAATGYIYVKYDVLESRTRQLETDNAVIKAQYDNINKKLDRMETKIDELSRK